uniref:HDC02020 n=1 Tax=Drosophila melanogaster TaxID=7227 RepID=Q6IHP2_DROME|nr:TPA_inf: HDC02020 [Drosophila melanogaster]
MPAYVWPHSQILQRGDKLSNYKMDNSLPIASTTYANGPSATAMAWLHPPPSTILTTACTTWAQLRLIKVVAINRNEISAEHPHPHPYPHPLPARHPHTRRLLTAVGRD